MTRTTRAPDSAAAFTAEEAHWMAIPADDYDAAVYANPLLSRVFVEELEVASGLASPLTTLVEVGCGTCMFASHMAPHVGAVIGVDISRDFLEAGRRRFVGHANVQLLEGDAAQLRRVLAPHKPVTPHLLVACVMNTLGIMPQRIRGSVMAEMARLAGPTGTVLVVVFNGEHFEEGVRNFYCANPNLCGPIGVKDVHYATRELRVADTGYYSHWFTLDEIRTLAKDAGLNVRRIVLSGVGLFVIANGCPS